MSEVALTASQARELTEEIKHHVTVVWNLVVRAYTARAWSALGYSSWDDYCTREFGTARLRLPREERAEVVSSLRESGLSIRAIASATGIDKNTVQSDLNEVYEIHTPEPEVNEDVLAEELIAAHAEPAPVIGVDGKTYTAARSAPKPPPQPEHPRRKPIADSARDIALDLKNITVRLEKLLADDRFARNADQVAAQIRHHLSRAIEVCQQVDSRINN